MEMICWGDCRPPCVKGALPEGRWGIVRQADGYAVQMAETVFGNPQSPAVTAPFKRSLQSVAPEEERQRAKSLLWKGGGPPKVVEDCLVQAGDNNPSVTLRVPPPFTQGRLLRTAREVGPYGCLTEALFSRPFALKARGNTHRALGGPPKVVEGSFDKPGKG